MDPTQTTGNLVPLWLLAPLGAALLALWVAAHLRLRPERIPWGWRGVFVFRAMLGALAWWSLIRLVGNMLSLGTGWSEWPIAVLGGTATETVVALYATERQTLNRYVGRSLLALRLFLVAMVLGMLLQPVLTYETESRRERYVAVLMDESASMRLNDPQSTSREKLELARAYGLACAFQANPLEATSYPLSALRQEFESQLASLDLPRSGDAAAIKAELRRRWESIARLLDKTQRMGEEQRRDLLKALETSAKAEAKTLQALRAVRDRWGQFLDGPVARTRKLPGGDAVALDPLRSELRHLLTSLKQLEAEGQSAPELIADAWASSLSGSEANEVDRLAREPRLEVARQVLLAEKAGAAALLDEFGKDHPVKFYRFASSPKAVDAAQWRSLPWNAAGADASEGQSAAEWTQATDLMAALRLVQQEIPADQLAGVVVLSDGRHNRGAPAEPIARRLGQQGVPVCSVVFGSSSHRRGAIITDVQTAESVYLGDKILMTARVHATGLRGQSLKIKMFCDDNLAEEKMITAADDDFRDNVSLSYTPKKAGFYRCRVELEKPAGDSLDSNKQVDRRVMVSDTRIKLLLVDDRPRWEFRYLRNLFCGRDKTVQLQHVLLSPDRIEGAAERQAVVASATRPYGEFEATALPKAAEDWLKFDLIVLGDLPPSALDEGTIKTLKRFVGRQGGSLVVIAGPDHMPHAFADSELAEMLPATFEAGQEPVLSGPEPAYRLALTPEGGAHAIMKQRSNPTDSAAVWKSMPTMDWRHPVQHVKPGATVLAYAEPAAASEGDGVTAAERDAGPPTARVSDMDSMRLQRQNPLIVLQKFGAGNVLLLNFDRTWRLRYRVGDTHHHQFWSQVLRWATANRLAAGTAHVRLGTDRVRYQTDEAVSVRAQLLDEDANPVTNDTVTAKVIQGDRVVLKKTLAFVPDSHGLYQGDLGALAKPGAYRVELEGPTVSRLLAIDSLSGVDAEFLVTALDRSGELTELTVDWKLPRQLADLGGGKAVGPAGARELLDRFQKKSKTVREIKYVPLWDSWVPLCLILAAVSGEWILRKKVGLT